ncbi:MarR family transcriptional regulator [Gordonia sp. NB41Y]|uniref:MarR family winged helix-turn-helix transcriptional regulator n=1 Tax=Gordonia sp. NB41Y TaxID=875808 RepID=UPI0002BFB85A|nr:MarR family transcriptional regulator [Gordonia sp. NB41Y]EMP13633.1 hypothetical protein ISGA_3235 [Gordonia sp. NB41Y]WLP89844.1 MarR family transcriptional regulator [Gordonia sp. NB41Y]
MPQPTASASTSPASDTPDVVVLYHDLVRITRALRTAGRGGLTAGLSSALWTILAHGPLRLSDLSDREGVSMPTMSRVVGTLEQHGYVERTPDPDDGRARLLVATDLGRDYLREARSHKAQVLTTALDQLDPVTRTNLQTGLRALADTLADPETEPIPEN